MDEDDEIKHMVSQYQTYNNTEKDIFWLKHSNIPFSDISVENDLEMMLISKVVNIYINASDKEKEILWSLCKDAVQLYCDRKKWRIKFRNRQEYKSNFKKLCPGADQDFYDYIADKYTR